MHKIKFFVMDVDGTLTDGKIYMSNEGEMFKAFDIKDGYGIHSILNNYGIIPIVITGRISNIVENRAAELEISELYQGVADKRKQLIQVIQKFRQENQYEYGLENVAYIGDDVNDIPVMMSVKKAGGLVGCPLDAAANVRTVSDFVSQKKGGSGAVRDFIEWITKAM